ncbi:biliverdin-producing heme oxygenase [Ramlibacter sp. PS3R-8]|uniref:biliverdin-producing heme oxygenase n=1 Tax=Ramlibacter sp. PS3R-8 TaxID=3133437 RepID=UPI00309765D4
MQFAEPALLEPGLHAPLAALRAATRDHHLRLDRLMDLRLLGDAARYATVLQAFDGFLSAWESTVAAGLPAARQPWLQARSRRHFVARDLQVLGIAASTLPVQLTPIATGAAAWGSLYVMEGSALGGRVIARALAAQGLRPDTGAAYFHGWGESTGPMWREFRQLLEQELATPAAVSLACAGACATFDDFSALLEGALA